MPPNTQHQSAPHAPQAPVIRRIKASAGSGKTYDLTRRFLEFLACSEASPHQPLGFLSGRAGWGDILAVTFTNAAAAEMKTRIVRALKESALGLAQGGPLVAARALLWVDIILRQYGALNVRTIDSLLQMVARSSSAGLGLPPDFEISFRHGDVFGPLADEFMERARDRGDTVYNMVYDACFSLVHHEAKARFMAGGIMEQRLFPLLEMVLAGQAEGVAGAGEIRAAIERLKRAVMDGAIELSKLLEQAGIKNRADVGKVLARAAVGDEKAFISAWLAKNELDDCLLKDFKGRAPEAACLAYERLALAAERWSGNGVILRRALGMVPFLTLAKALGERVAEFQAREGVVPGFAMARLAARALAEGASQAVCRLGSGLNHLFVDEFQDTSREQWSVLQPLVAEALARGGSLTVVGDVKQAVYGWRGGDAELFDSVGSGMAEGSAGDSICAELAEEVLPSNWRSKAEIVKFNNMVFAPLADPPTALRVMAAMMPKDTLPEPLGRTAGLLAWAFRGATQTLPDNGRADGGHVTVRAIEVDSGEDLEAARFAAVMDLLGDLALRRPYGDIAVLVRTNDEAKVLAAGLMEAHIPVMTENSLVLDEHPLIRELTAFLTFLDSPDDDLAFWSVIDGHIMAGAGFLPREELLALAAGRGKLTLYDAFRREFPELWADLFEPFLNQNGLTVVYDLVREIYRRFDLLGRFAQDEVFLQRFLEIAYLAEGRGISALPAFLDSWHESGAEEKAPMPATLDAVRVMTIHKSKGLEFPVVIIPSLAFSRRGDASLAVLEIEGLKVIARAGREMGDDYVMARGAELREAMNLCYVAFTRAACELHILHSSTADQRKNAGSVQAMDELFAACGFELPLSIGDAKAAGSWSGEQACTLPEAEPLDYSAWPGGWRPMDWLPRLKIFRNSLAERDEAALRGEFIHACLAHAAQMPELEPERVVDAAITGLPFALPEAMRGDAPEIIRWVRALPGFAELVPGCLVEQPLFGADGKMRRTDFVATCPQSGRATYIIDYKTGRAEEKHLEQVREYMALLASCGESGPEPRAALIYVDQRFCRLVEINGVRDSDGLL